MFEISEAELKNLSRGSNMIGSTKIVFNVSRFKPALSWNRFLADLRRGSNSLNSDSVSLKWMEKLPKSVRFASFYIVLHRFWIFSCSFFAYIFLLRSKFEKMYENQMFRTVLRILWSHNILASWIRIRKNMQIHESGSKCKMSTKNCL